MTMFVVLLMAYIENNFYMMSDTRWKWLKIFKAVFYLTYLILLGVINGIGLRRYEEQGDYAFNQVPYIAQRVLMIIVGVMTGKWFLACVMQTFWALCNWKKLKVEDGVHFFIHLGATLMFIICLSVGAFTPRYNVGMLTSFMLSFVNLYVVFMMFLHAPSTKEYLK